jgi:cytidine deaminase
MCMLATLLIPTPVSSPSDVPEPTTSPCGICRQFIREFCPLDMPIYMIASTFPADAPQEQALAALADYKYVKVMSLEQLLPMSFGPGNLEVPRQ